MIMLDVVIDLISDIIMYMDRPKYEFLSSSPMDIRMTLGHPKTLYRDWAISRGGGTHKHKSWPVNRYIYQQFGFVNSTIRYTRYEIIFK